MPSGSDTYSMETKPHDMRGKRIALVAHCHLNVNTKIAGYADYPGARANLIPALIEDGIGIIQLPCPEIAHSGMARWSACYEQYDTVAFRATAREILGPVITALVELTKDGVECAGIYGVDGSPSCGVNYTCEGYAGGSLDALDAPPHAHRADHHGVFIEELKAALAAAGLEHIGTKIYGVEERIEDTGM